MLFEVGETVVYPHHGAATIIEVKDRIIKGETKKYLKLNVTQETSSSRSLPTTSTWSVFVT
jgi:RNA polymerase-interacting CarD/CdnL/TRCF family regulator